MKYCIFSYKPSGDVVHARNEDGIRDAVHGKRSNSVVVFNWAYKVLFIDHAPGYEETDKEGTDTTTDKTLPGLLW